MKLLHIVLIAGAVVVVWHVIKQASIPTTAGSGQKLNANIGQGPISISILKDAFNSQVKYGSG